MNSFEQSGKGLKRLLISSVAVIGLTSAAQGQVVELQGLMDNKDFGGGTSLYMPFGSVSSGMPSLSIGAGLLGGEMNGQILGGYGQSFGNVGIRGYAGVGLKEGKNNKLFTTFKSGIEVVVGGFGLNVSGSVPFGKTRQVASQGHADMLFVDKEPTGDNCTPSTGCIPIPKNSCSNPLPGQMKQCEVAIAVTAPGYEKALKGFEVGLDYQLQIGSVVVTPSLGYYRYGNGLVSGAKAGLELSVPLTSQLSLNVGAGANKTWRGNDNKGVSGFGSLGVSYHFGATPASQLSSLERRFAQAPNGNQRSVTTHTEKGNTVVYRNQPGSGQGFSPVVPMVGVIWDHNSRKNFVSDIYGVDATTASQLDDIVAKAVQDSIVVVDGSKGDINLDNVVEFKNPGVGVVGGGSVLKGMATIDGGKTFFNVFATMPGIRPTLVQADNTKNIFYANGVENPILRGLDMRGGNNGVEFISANQARISQVKAENAANNGFSLVKSEEAMLVGVTTSFSGQDGFYFEDSPDALLLDVNSILDMRNGFYFLRSDDAHLFSIFSSAEKKGVYFEQSDDAYLGDISITGTAQAGILFDNSHSATLNVVLVQSFSYGVRFLFSNSATLNHVQVSKAFYGIDFYFSNSSSLSDVYVTDVGYGVNFAYSHSATLSNVEMVDVYQYGLQLEGGTDIHLDNLRIKGEPNSRGIMLKGAGQVRKEITFKNVSVSNVEYAYIFLNSSFVKDLGSNVALLAKYVCDGVIDTTGSVLVNGINKCQ